MSEGMNPDVLTRVVDALAAGGMPRPHAYVGDSDGGREAITLEWTDSDLSMLTLEFHCMPAPKGKLSE